MKNISSISTFKYGIVPPRSGQMGHYFCQKCGNRFTRKIPLFFDFGIKCPKCGSYKVVRDPTIVY
jgi:DNA-directed RNA polymerase subunit RPC12/RpoP